MARIVILGGGFGGAAAARTLAERLGAHATVTLIDRNGISRLCGMNPLLMAGLRDARATSRDLSRLARWGVRFQEAEIRSIALDDQEIRVGRRTVPFDYLIVALGAGYDWEAVPGSSHVHTFYDFEATKRLRSRLGRLERGRVIIVTAGAPYKCPPAPFEAAMLLNAAFRTRGVRRHIDIDLLIPEPEPLAVAGPTASERVRAALANRRIGLRTGLTAEAIDGRTVSLSDGSTERAELVILVPRHVVPPVVDRSGLTNGSPWVPVDPTTLETSRPNVFAIGDVNSVPFAPGKALPKAGVFAAGQGVTAGEEIASRITGAEPPAPYLGAGQCFLGFSPGTAALVGGTFLAPGGPAVGLSSVSTAGAKRKLRFEESWRRFQQ